MDENTTLGQSSSTHTTTKSDKPGNTETTCSVYSSMAAATTTLPPVFTFMDEKVLNARVKLETIKDTRPDEYNKKKNKFNENEKTLADCHTAILVFDSFLKYTPALIFGGLGYYWITHFGEGKFVVELLFFVLLFIWGISWLRTWYEHKLNVLWFDHRMLIKELEKIGSPSDEKPTENNKKENSKSVMDNKKKFSLILTPILQALVAGTMAGITSNIVFSWKNDGSKVLYFFLLFLALILLFVMQWRAFEEKPLP